MAIPAYQTYLVRTRISQAINFLDACKAEYTEYFSSNGQIPSSISNLPACVIDNNTGVQYIQKVTNSSAQGRINAYLKSDVVPGFIYDSNDAIISLSLTKNDGKSLFTNVSDVENYDFNGSYQWACYIQTSNTSDRTNLLRYMPSTCRHYVSSNVVQ
ncbi:pilin [Acinetobacter qingfengensis]|uniref:pilin n=1 Tax=Acinetobacter qingfengensis TaxID=1262585 RepID=UPI003899523A